MSRRYLESDLAVVVKEQALSVRINIETFYGITANQSQAGDSVMLGIALINEYHCKIHVARNKDNGRRAGRSVQKEDGLDRNIKSWDIDCFNMFCVNFISASMSSTT